MVSPALAESFGKALDLCGGEGSIRRQLEKALSLDWRGDCNQEEGCAAIGIGAVIGRPLANIIDVALSATSLLPALFKKGLLNKVAVQSNGGITKRGRKIAIPPLKRERER